MDLNPGAGHFLIQGPEDDAPYYLATTAHSLKRTKGETATLVPRRAKDNGTYERHDYTIAIRNGKKLLWVQHPDHDIAILKLPGPLPLPVNAIPLAWLADDDRLKAAGVDICSPLFLLTYPERFEANAAGFPVARQGIFSNSPLLPSSEYLTYLADFTAFSGDSGGPVFVPTEDGQTPLIVGMVLGRHFHDENIKAEYEERRIRHPLGLGIVLHARYIRETCQQATQ